MRRRPWTSSARRARVARGATRRLVAEAPRRPGRVELAPRYRFSQAMRSYRGRGALLSSQSRLLRLNVVTGSVSPLLCLSRRPPQRLRLSLVERGAVLELATRRNRDAGACL